MSKATSAITSRFKMSWIAVANESESVAAQKLMFKLGFKTARNDSREVSNNPDVRFIYVNNHCQMFLYTEEAKGNKWRETNFEELSKAVLEVTRIKRDEGKAQKKRKALRKWDATATKKTHNGCPVNPDVIVAVRLRSGTTFTCRAGDPFWGDCGVATVESYKVIGYPKPKGKVVSLESMVGGIAESLGREVAVPVSSAEILDASNNVIGFTRVKEVADTDTNPKRQYGVSSIPLEMWPDLASAYGALALYNGSLKYGKANFANTPVEASIYIAALRRHLASWVAGEEFDPADGVPHLGGVLANAAILISARAAGTLIDDRMLLDGFLTERDALKAIVPKLQALHADKNPKHYTRDKS